MKIHVFMASVTALAVTVAGDAAAASVTFRAPGMTPEIVALGAPKAMATAPSAPLGGRLYVGDVRPLEKSVSLARWEAVEGGFVARLRAQSATAQGLRVRLDLGAMPGSVEVSAQGSGAPIVETMIVDPTLGNEAWTPWTDGDTQVVEVFSSVRPSTEAIAVGAILHLDASPVSKAAASCTLSTACTSNDPALDALINERKRSNMRIQFVSGGKGYVCSATLIDTPQRPVAHTLTANHCITTPAEAASITTLWFYEQTSCGGPNNTGTQVAGGTTLEFTNSNVDATLVRMNQPPPANAAYAPLDPNLVATDTSIVSISNPTGDSTRWAEGTMVGQGRPSDPIDVPYNMYVVRFTRGMVQGGSSGSGAFTRTANGLAITGMLSLGPLDESCDSTSTKFGVYSRLEVFYPEISQYIGVTTQGADDAPNRPTDVTADVGAGPLDAQAQPVRLSRRIDYAGDVDVFRFTLSSPAAVTIYTESTLDLVSSILDADGVAIAANDDAQASDNNTGITRVLDIGTYYVHVAHWIPTGTGAYNLVLRSDRVDRNYTALWWNPNESGWGININHQSSIIFATLFSYDDDGSPMWLVMPRGDRQASDGSYSGPLYRTTGPAFNTTPWRAATAAEVGTMRISFGSESNATLTYSVNGRSVTKSISRQLFKTPPECTWSYFDRSYEDNVTDLWWNPNESGWGLNLTQQEDTVFGTLFTYGADGKGLWLVMPAGTMSSDRQVTGAIYRTRGPRFDASPWGTVTPTAAGTMTIGFDDGNTGSLNYTLDGVTVNKTITRQVFGTLKTKCVQP